MLGEDLLVAPMFRGGENDRMVYLPAGNRWVDYQSKRAYLGGTWQTIAPGEVPIVLLVREGAVIPEARPALTTADMDFGHLEIHVYAQEGESMGLVCLPDGQAEVLRLVHQDGTWQDESGALRDGWKVVQQSYTTAGD